MLYVDDMLLLLGDSDVSLRVVMSAISHFGKYSGLTINWTKSTLLHLDVGLNPPISLFLTGSGCNIV